MIYLYGKLRTVFGDSINCKVNSVQEMMKAAEANRPGFRGYIEKDRKYVIRRGKDFRTANDVSEEEVEMKFSDDSWHILPMPIGSGKALGVILGVVLLVVAYVNPYGFLSGPAVSGLYAAGTGMVLGGVSQMLAPSPQGYGQESDANERPSYLFDGPTNRSAPGGAVTLIYGFDVFVGSTFTSGGIDIGDIV